MLCVMLIGRFPFEGIEMHNVSNMDDVSAHVGGPFVCVGGCRGCLPELASVWYEVAS